MPIQEVETVIEDPHNEDKDSLVTDEDFSSKSEEPDVPQPEDDVALNFFQNDPIEEKDPEFF